MSPSADSTDTTAPHRRQRHVVFGAGPIGRATAVALVALGHDVTVATRSGTDPEIDGVEVAVGDAGSIDSIVAIADGAASIVNCVNPPYDKWAATWPTMSAAFIGAAERTGAVLVTMSNLYGYEHVAGRPMSEATPLVPPSKKGQIRADMWLAAKAAHDAGRIRATEARASDFIGPGLGDGSHMGDRVTARLAAGKGAQVIGALDQPHTWTYVPDVGRTLATLATDERAWGEVWHVPSNEPRTVRQVVSDLAAAAERNGAIGVSAKVSSMPKIALRVAGLFSPTIRQLAEIRYQFDEPFVMDSSRFAATFGTAATPWNDVMSASIGEHLPATSGDLPPAAT